MSRFEDFKVRDRVAHVLIGDGRVTAIDDAVHVRFDRTRGKIDGKPKHVEGTFDRRWFALNPEYLFKRTTKKDREGDTGSG